MRVAIAIPIYLKGRGNQPCYERCISHYAKSGYPVVICGSEGDLSRGFARPFLSENVTYKEVPQMHGTIMSGGDDSLREKFNDSLKALPKSDWYCLAGADDFAPLSIFEQLKELDASKVIMAGVGNGQPLLIHQIITGESMRVELSYDVKLLPGINIFSRGAMKQCKFRPYQLKGCETGAEKYFDEHGEVVPLDGHIVMLKYQEELNNYAKIKRKHYNVPVTKHEQSLIDECRNP